MAKLGIPFCSGDGGLELFARNLKREIENLESGTLPLERATTQGGLVDDSDVSATIVSVAEGADVISARVGVFFNEVTGGCSCGDDVASENAYCEIEVCIDKTTGEMTFEVVSEGD